MLLRALPLLALCATAAAWAPARPRAAPRALAASSARPDLDALRVPELKDRLRERGLLVGGLKAELIARLDCGSEAPASLASPGSPDVGSSVVIEACKQ